MDGSPSWPALPPARWSQRVRCLLTIEDVTLTVRGLDAIDGSPVLDLEPCMVELAPRGDVHQPTWSRELMAKHSSVPPAQERSCAPDVLHP